eukprot:1043395-Prorocentrum_minimum.AAC.1
MTRSGASGALAGICNITPHHGRLSTNRIMQQGHRQVRAPSGGTRPHHEGKHTRYKVTGRWKRPRASAPPNKR